MTNDPTPTTTGDAPPLLDGPTEPPAALARGSMRGRLQSVEARLRSAAVRAWHRPRVRAGWLAAAAVLLAGGGAAIYTTARIEPPPDYTAEPLDVLFEYTLLTDDFNRLPLERRLELLAQLRERLSGLGSSDSVLIAGVAAAIAGEAREQLEKNVGVLMVDLFDSYAARYDPTAPAEDRRAFMERAYLDLTATVAELGGDVDDVPAEERLERARTRNERRGGAVREGEVGAGDLARMFDVVNNGIGRHADAHQKIRITAFVRDMSRTLRTD